MIDIQHAKIGYQEKRSETVIFQDFNCQIKKGQLYCILGANGVGKTTLFRTILGFIPPLNGKIFVDETDIRKIRRKELAKKIAYVPQYHMPPFPYKVMDVVLMGRGAHLSEFQTPEKEDEDLACSVMKKLDILSLKDKLYTKLSGGERQLVLIARALVQQTEYLFMDEPAANLDYGNQIRILQILSELAKTGKGICFTTHSPEHAAWCNAKVIAIESREKICTGFAQEVISESLLEAMYKVKVTVKKEMDSNRNDQMVIIPNCLKK